MIRDFVQDRLLPFLGPAEKLFGRQQQNVTVTERPDPVTDYYRQAALAAAARAAGIAPYGSGGEFPGGPGSAGGLPPRRPGESDLSYGVRVAMNQFRGGGAAGPLSGQYNPNDIGTPPIFDDPGTFQGLDSLRSTVDFGGLGRRALSGDQTAISSFLNPFTENVINRVRDQFGRLNAQAQLGVNDAATRARAFGGSRHGVASGAAAGEIARGLGDQIAALQAQGFEEAMRRAQYASQLGFVATNPMVQLSLMVDRFTDPNRYRTFLLQEGMAGMPTGSATTQPYFGPSPFEQIAGAGLTLTSLFGGFPGGGIKGSIVNDAGPRSV